MIKTDILIIGGGAAGLSAGQYGARAGRDVVIVEALMPGGQCAYIDLIENYPGFDTPVTGFEIGDRMQKQAEAFGAKIVYDEFVSFEKKDDIFFVKLAGQEVEAKSIIWATGAKHRHINIPGEEEFVTYGPTNLICRKVEPKIYSNVPRHAEEAGDVEKAFRRYKEMQNSNIVPDEVTYNLMLNLTATNGDFFKMFDVLNAALCEGEFDGVFSENSTTGAIELNFSCHHRAVTAEYGSTRGQHNTTWRLSF